MTPWCVLALQGDWWGLKNADLLNKSQFLKTVICPWKILEKSLKFVCLNLYKPCIWTSNQRAIGLTPFGSTQIFFPCRCVNYWLNNNLSQVKDAMHKGITVCERWVSTCETLTSQYWKRFPSHPWRGEKFTPENLSQLATRLEEVLYIFGIFSWKQFLQVMLFIECMV